MVRVGISVEGATEERFVKMVLAPYLATKQIYVISTMMLNKLGVYMGVSV